MSLRTSEISAGGGGGGGKTLGTSTLTPARRAAISLSLSFQHLFVLRKLLVEELLEARSFFGKGPSIFLGNLLAELLLGVHFLEDKVVIEKGGRLI